MKKIFLLCSFLFLIFSFSSFSQEVEGVTQVILPTELYIGDQAEIRYSFRSAVDFFSGERNVSSKEIENPFAALEDKFTVIKSELLQRDMEYTVRFVIVPWKVGTIVFPSFDLNKALSVNPAKEENPEFIISLYPVQINSIVEKTDKRQMMPPVPPIIIPGTTYVIFLIVLATVIFLILFFRFLLKFNSIRKKWRLYLLKRAYRKNAEEAIRKIKRLVKSLKTPDIEFCSLLQQFTRNYLDFRFDYRFSAISASGIKKAFEVICAGEIPSEISTAVDDLAAMFIRTDYIRYAHDSIDSQLYPPAEHQASLGKNERKQLSQMVIGAIATFESDDSNVEVEDDDVR